MEKSKVILRYVELETSLYESCVKKKKKEDCEEDPTHCPRRPLQCLLQTEV